MIVLELGNETILCADDGGGALRELVHQALRDTGHLPLRGGARTPGMGGPVPAEFGGEQIRKDALVHLGEHDRRGEESPAVESTPDAIARGLDPVKYDHVVVELGIAVAGVEVGEARRYHPDDVLLEAALLARSSAKHLALGVGEDLGDGLLVAPVDHFAGVLVSQGPGHGHALGGAECKVETADALGARGFSEHLAGDRVGAVLEHPLEVLRGHGLSDGNPTTVVETDQAGAEEDSRRGTGF